MESNFTRYSWHEFLPYIYSSIKINYRKMQVLLDLTGFFVIIVLMFSSIEEVDYYA